jgi:hypothetical protein
MNYLILSRHDEPLQQELEQFSKFSDWCVTIYNKSSKSHRILEEIFLEPNVGFEAYSYLRWMIDNHNIINDSDVAVFSQYDVRPFVWVGTPGFTLPEMAKRALIAGASAEIVHQSIGHSWQQNHDENNWWRYALDDLGIELPKHVIFSQQAYFALRGDIIKSVSLELLEKSLQFLLQTKSRGVRHLGKQKRNMAKHEAQIFERIWFILFNIKTIYPIKSMGWCAWNKLPEFYNPDWMWPKEPYNIYEKGEEIDRMISNNKRVVLKFDPIDGWGMNSLK